MSPVAVSVLTLVKGRPLHLARLIDGLRRSHISPAELIVVDLDGEYVPPGGSGLPIRVIRLPSAGLPLSQARNAAAAAASSEVLLFLDVDCIPLGTLVGAMGERCTRTPGLICAEVKYLGPGLVPDDWDEHDLLDRALPHPVRHFPESGLRRETNYGLFWSLAFGITRSLFRRLGGFDEAFAGYGAEDTDFGFQARRAEVDLFFLGGTGALHQHHGVYDPPLQHFTDIIRNATLFHHKWQAWPMTGWLDRFAQLGLVTWHDDAVRILRQPTAAEIAGARRDGRF
jgi:glycosyltransferase involved in cell wall biosynthesis